MEAVAMLNHSVYDCVLLDVMLPGLDGFAICEAARKKIKTPIIFLSAMDGEEDRVKGLMAGDDDYICNPYSLKELGARVYAQIRRSRIAEGDQAAPTSVLFDKALRTITIHGTNIILTEKEYDVLSLLMAGPGRIISPDEIMDRVWGGDSGVDEANVRVVIGRVRVKLNGAEAGSVDNVFGDGYHYTPPGGIENEEWGARGSEGFSTCSNNGGRRINRDSAESR